MKLRSPKTVATVLVLGLLIGLMPATSASAIVIWWPWRGNANTAPGVIYTAGNWDHWGSKARLRLSDNPTLGLAMYTQIRTAAGAIVATSSAGGWSWSNLSLGSAAVNSRNRCWWTTSQALGPIAEDCHSYIVDPGGLARVASPTPAVEPGNETIVGDVDVEVFPKSISLDVLGGDGAILPETLVHVGGDKTADFWEAQTDAGERCLLVYQAAANVASSACGAEKTFRQHGIGLQLGTDVVSEAYLIPGAAGGVLLIADPLSSTSAKAKALTSGLNGFELDVLPAFNPR